MILVPEKISNVAKSQPNALAIISGTERLTYGQLSDQVDQEAGRLVSLGVGRGVSVAIVAENSSRYLVVALAVWRLGGIIATVYPTSGEAELSYVIQNSSPAVIFADADRLGAVTKAASGAGSAAEIIDLALRPETGAEGGPNIAIAPESPCLICYTSGTTARPKPVAHSYRGILGAAATYGAMWHFAPGDKVLIALPLAWVYGLVTAATSALINGACIVLIPHFNPVKVIEIIEREQVTIFPAVTTMFVKLVGYMNESGLEPDLTSLKVCITGGEARNETIFSRWTSLSGCNVHDVYASSECFPQVTYDIQADPVPKYGSAGKVARGAELSIRDVEGRPVAAGEVGIGFARSPGTMLGYWNEPELTKGVLTEDGWYKTNDLMYIDPDGYAYIVGRASDMIIRGGSNVSPAEVEAVLSQHPRIKEAVIFGLPDAMYGQKVAAALITSDEETLTPEELRDFCKDRLAPYKVPTAVRTFSEFPRNANGKTLRRELVALCSADSTEAAS